MCCQWPVMLFCLFRRTEISNKHTGVVVGVARPPVKGWAIGGFLKPAKACQAFLVNRVSGMLGLRGFQ